MSKISNVAYSTHRKCLPKGFDVLVEEFDDCVARNLATGYVDSIGGTGGYLQHVMERRMFHTRDRLGIRMVSRSSMPSVSRNVRDQSR
jgi:hypothetical protein